MRRHLWDKSKESAKSVIPISIIVILLHFTIAPMPGGTLALFLSGTFLLIIGMGLFTLGSDMAMMPMGSTIGSALIKTKKLWLIMGGCFILGIIITVAEPDLHLLTKRVPSVSDTVLIMAVAVGVGIFLALALLRIFLQIKLKYIFITCYALIFILAAFTSPDFLALSIDAGGVTTGPITVPFILAMGAGVSSVRSGKSAEEDSFGLCGISSVGPVLAVLVLGVFFDSSGGGFDSALVNPVDSVGELFALYGEGLLQQLKEVATALLPIALVFAVFQKFKLKLPKGQIIKIVVGLVYSLAGITIFLTGVNIGFIPAGQMIGEALASLDYNWILIPIGVIIGFFIITAEPAVHVLNKQVEEITSGAISKKMMMIGLSIGVGIAVALSMIRILNGISIWYFLLPGYILAMILAFIVPDIFTAISFDSGGVASGTMATAFLLPMAIGVCNSMGGNIMTDAFGIIGMVAMMPLVTVQIMGLLYQIKMRRAEIRDNLLDDEESLQTEDDINDDNQVIEM